jgi:hypothetical protein
MLQWLQAPLHKNEWQIEKENLHEVGSSKQLKKEPNFSPYNPKQGHWPGPFNQNKQLRMADQELRCPRAGSQSQSDLPR